MNTATYLAGMIERDDQTPNHILNTCYDWFDGRRSAMYRFSKGEQVKPSALQREASKALGENLPGAADEDARLKALRAWAIRQDALVEAVRELRDASEAFRLATANAGLDEYDTARLWEAAIAKRSSTA